MMQNRKSGVRSHEQGEGGFTLIETIVTLLVLSIAAVGVYALFATGIKRSADPLLTEQATQLAQGEMDQVLGERSANGFPSIAIVSNSPTCNSVMLAGFTCSRTVYFVNSGALNTQVAGPTDYKHVTVTIAQTTVGSVSLDSIISNY